MFIGEHLLAAAAKSGLGKWAYYHTGLVFRQKRDRRQTCLLEMVPRDTTKVSRNIAPTIEVVEGAVGDARGEMGCHILPVPFEMGLRTPRVFS